MEFSLKISDRLWYRSEEMKRLMDGTEWFGLSTEALGASEV